MLAGEIPGSVDVLAELRAAGLRLVALSNWSVELFPVARERFDFLAWFEGILISGEVGVNKPDRKIFEHLIERFGIEPATAIFIDDSSANVATAATLEFSGIQFTDAGGSLASNSCDSGSFRTGGTSRRCDACVRASRKCRRRSERRPVPR